MDTDTELKEKKKEIFKRVHDRLAGQGFSIVDQDENRPWGGFFVIAEEQTEDFINVYFTDYSRDELNISGKLSPKILIVAPGKRLSWQYHYRRAEIWKVVDGPVGIIKSNTDEQGELERYKSGEAVTLEQEERHRLVGLDNWAVLAEIWQHTDPENPSDEDDIVRLQDDYGR
ncbi:phosphoheptose isomerase [Aliifodinibius salicampi]|uniref:Phosphoheptose isomerase n=1 Tax=Fodinibius salicampi TaxID=1920655 RepID=A0ABT3PYV4_9BACT|nr:phosphoheptose isomerase [Fodinibius salicampi]MCW9713047.1 phosphoheptose isomerase [Fodinibius salicampi]